MRTCLPILPALILISACNDGVILGPPQTHSHDNVSGIREGSWPPEPLGMENEQLLRTGVRPRARQAVLDLARRSIMNNPELIAAIGDRYGTFDTSLTDSKSDDIANFVFYNYDTDQTVKAVLGNDGAVNVSSLPASQWQPTENALEVEQAISLARTSLEGDSYALETLEGTAMLTYPAQELAAGDVPFFYDARMLYVTFGSGNGEPPLYSARVNIGAQTVSEGGAMR